MLSRSLIRETVTGSNPTKGHSTHRMGGPMFANEKKNIRYNPIVASLPHKILAMVWVATKYAIRTMALKRPFHHDIGEKVPHEGLKFYKMHA